MIIIFENTIYLYIVKKNVANNIFPFHKIFVVENYKITIQTILIHNINFNFVNNYYKIHKGTNLLHQSKNNEFINTLIID